jgi:predicted nucleotidyltransferase
MMLAGSGSRSKGAAPRKPARGKAGLADALFGSTQRRVLGLLFGQPQRSFFVTEIMALADAGRGAVQRELERLAQSCLVTITKVGTQKHYQANKESPLFEELCSIVSKTVGLQEPLREALAPLAKKMHLALIYGSIAKRLDTAASDIDLLIVSDDLTLEELYRALSPAEALLHRKINPTLYTAKEFKQRREARNPFLMRVLDGPTITLLGSLDGE